MKLIAKYLFPAFCFCMLIACNHNKAEASEAINNVAESVNPDNSKLPYRIVDNTFFNENIPLVVDFYADWCGPCKMYAPVFEAVAEKYSDAACFVSINADDYPKLCETYKISSIPTTLFIMPGGGLLGKKVGVLSQEELDTLVNQLLATSDGADMEL